jgi:hypothetical protein
MKTKKELDKLSYAIGVAERKYYNAVRDNLKESGKEYDVQSDYDEDDWDDVVGLHVTTTDRHDNNVIAVIDKIRFNTNCGIDGLVEVHVCAWDYVKKDYWADIQLFDSDVKPCVYDNIIW